MRCGHCGSSMTITGRHYDRGLSWANYGCSANHSRGASICPNGKTVSERIANRGVLALLSRAAESPRFRQWVEGAVAAVERARAKGSEGGERAELEGQVRAQEAKVARTADLLVEMGADALKAKLRAEEAKLLELRARLARAAALEAPRVVRKVSVDQVVAVPRSVERVAEKAPAGRARCWRPLLSRWS